MLVALGYYICMLYRPHLVCQDTSGHAMYLVLDHWIHYTIQMMRRIPLGVSTSGTPGGAVCVRMHLVLDHWIHYTLQMVWWIPYRIPLDVCTTGYYVTIHLLVVGIHDTSGGTYLVLDHWIHYTLQMVCGYHTGYL